MLWPEWGRRTGAIHIYFILTLILWSEWGQELVSRGEGEVRWVGAAHHLRREHEYKSKNTSTSMSTITVISVNMSTSTST